MENNMIPADNPYFGNEWKKCFLHDTLFNTMRECVVIYKAYNNGEDFIIIDFNDSASRLDKIDREEVIGKKVTEAFPGVREFGLFDVFQRVLRTGKSEDLPVTLYKDDRISGWRENFVFKVPEEDVVIAIYADSTAIKRAEQTIYDISKFAEEDPYPVLRVDAEGTLIYANKGSNLLLNYWDIKINEKISPDLVQTISLALKKDKHSLVEICCNDIIYSLVIAPVSEKNYVNIYGRDVTVKNKIENDLKKKNRLYAFLMQMNQTIIHTDNMNELFEQICQKAVKYGKFKLCWIGIVDSDSKRIKPYKYAGLEEGYLDNIYISTEDIPEGRGILGRSFREKKCAVSNDILDDPNMLPWRDAAIKRGYKSAAGVPFYLNNAAYGVIGFYAQEKNFFDTEEIHLLEEIGMEISFALGKLNNEKEKKIINDKLIKSESKHRKILTEMPIAVLSCNTEGNIQFVNKYMLDMLGSPSEEATKSVNLLTFPPLIAIGVPDLIRECIASGNNISAEKRYTSKWNKSSFYQCYFLPLSDENNIITEVLMIAHDLTELIKLKDELHSSRL